MVWRQEQTSALATHSSTTKCQTTPSSPSHAWHPQLPWTNHNFTRTDQMCQENLKQDFLHPKAGRQRLGSPPVSPQPVQYAVASLLAMSTALPPCLITRCHIHVNFDGSWTGRAPNIPANFLSFSQGLRILQAHTTADCRVKHRPQCLSPKTPASPCPKPGKCSCSQL